MARRRGKTARKTRSHDVEAAFRCHLSALGLTDADAYRQWCRQRGFCAKLDKHAAARERELAAAREERCRATLKGSRQLREPAKILERVCLGDLSAKRVRSPALREACAAVARCQKGGESRRSLALLLRLAGERSRLLGASTEWGGRHYPFAAGLVGLNDFRRFWIRLLEDWHPDSHNCERQFASLARHLLALYPVPEFLDSVWVRDHTSASLHRTWFLQIGSGQSVQSLETPIPMTRRMAHLFLHAPPTDTVEHALRRAQVHALGGDDRLAEAILGTRLRANFENDEFWTSVIRFFIRHPMLSRTHVGPIIDYIHNQRFAPQEVFVTPGVVETRPPTRPKMCMKGRSPKTLLREVDRWHGVLARQRGKHLQWVRSEIMPYQATTRTREGEMVVWRIRELLSRAELVAEGRAMRHCVASYALACHQRRCSIWTMERETSRGVTKSLTIEVSPKGVIEQCSGRCNRIATPKEWAVLRAWARQSRLTFAPWIR